MIKTYRSENKTHSVDLTNTTSGYILFATEKATRFTDTMLIKKEHLELLREVLEQERTECEYIFNI